MSYSPNNNPHSPALGEPMGVGDTSQLTPNLYTWGEGLAPEAKQSHIRRVDSGFYKMYMSGKGIDVGYKGAGEKGNPILPTAIGYDLGTEGYDGIHLPLEDSSVDYIFTSHTLEHMGSTHYLEAIREWLRVVKIGGHIIITVPHQFLYEKRRKLPSKWNRDHKRFYTPASLMAEIELALKPNTYRLVHLKDNDVTFNYSIPPDKHSAGAYEIECVLKKINPPNWELA